MPARARASAHRATHPRHARTSFSSQQPTTSVSRRGHTGSHVPPAAATVPCATGASAHARAYARVRSGTTTTRRTSAGSATPPTRSTTWHQRSPARVRARSEAKQRAREKERKADEKRRRKAEAARIAMEEGDPFGSELARKAAEEYDDDDDDD